MNSRIYKTNYWIFDPHNQELISNNSEVKQLPNRLNKCLQVLITAEGRTVSHDELLEKVWGTTHRDASTISSVISELRQLLATEDKAENAIRTVPKKGYRFVLEVWPESSNVKTPASDTTADSSEKTEEKTTPQDAIESDVIQQLPRQSRFIMGDWFRDLFRTKYTGFALGLCVAVSLSIIGSTFTLPPAKVAITNTNSNEIEILTYDFGTESDFDVSADGSLLAYTRTLNDSDKSSIVLKNLATGTLSELPRLKGTFDHSPSISSDRSMLSFVRNGGIECEVWLINLEEEQFVSDSARKVSECGASGVWLTTDFSPDGQSLYFSRSESLADPFKVIKHNIRTGYERAISSPTANGRGDYSATVSRDGQHVAIVRNLFWHSSQLVLLDVLNNESKVIKEIPYLIERLDFVDNNTLVFKDPKRGLISYDLRSERENTTILSGKFNYPVVANGKVYVYRGNYSQTSLFKVSETSENQWVAEPHVVSPFSDFNAIQISETETIFQSNRSGNVRLWRQQQGQYNLISEFPENLVIQALDFSQANNKLIGASNNKIFTFSLDQNTLEWLTTGNDKKVVELSMIDDDNVIITVEDNESWYLFRLNLITGEEQSLNINGFKAAYRDEKIVYSTFRNSQLRVLDLASKQDTVLIEQLDLPSQKGWGLLGDKLLLTSENAVKVKSLGDDKSEEKVMLNNSVKSISCSEAFQNCIIEVSKLSESEIIAIKLPVNIAML